LNGLSTAKDILKRYWNYDHFRPGQEEIIQSAIYGKDTLALLPTGGGKSICYQVPGLAREGLTIVISPLIALMQDQVDQLLKRGIRAAAIHTGMTYREIDILLDNAAYGGLDFLYISPERIDTKLFTERVKKMNLALLVVDEAHCISEWGHEFRPSYRNIAQIRDEHAHVPIVAVTATATQQVKEDILLNLKLKAPQVFVGKFQRENLSLNMDEVENKFNRILHELKKYPQQSGIVYCQTRKSVKEVVRVLHDQKISVGMYHGGMKKDDREFMQKAWVRNEVLVMVATNAFGMGIDKGDVRFVIHYELPNNIEAYYQEAGRAGRDLQPAKALALYTQKEFNLLKEQVMAKYPEKKEIVRVYRALCNHLQVAIHSGKHETFPLDIRALSKHFNIEIQLIFHALKMLETNGNLQFNEGFFQPTKLKIAVGNNELYNYQIKNQRLSPLISMLTRSYPGIFDLFMHIDEVAVAKRLIISREELTQQLTILEKTGLIDITWASDQPTVTFLMDRPANDEIHLSYERYGQLKEKAHYRLDSMVALASSKTCRNQQIQNYFGLDAQKCGNCVYCLRTQPEEIQSRILDLLKKAPLSLHELTDQVQASQNEIRNILEELLHLEKISSDNNGKYLIN
jgi:ATP-dependent DNA helicase RecQ